MQQTVCHVIGSLASSKQGHVRNQQLHQTWSSYVNCMQAVACWLASAVHLTSGRCVHSKTCLGLIRSGLPACGMTASATSHIAWPQYVASTICLKHPLFCSNLCCVLMTEQACQQGWSRLFLWAQLCAADCIHTSADRSAAATESDMTVPSKATNAGQIQWAGQNFSQPTSYTTLHLQPWPIVAGCSLWLLQC